MNKALTKGLFLATLFIAVIFSLVTFTSIHAAEDTITATSSTYDGTTIIEYQNPKDSGLNVDSIRVWLDRDVNFKSFKTEKGWVGKKSLSDVITFATTESMKPGQSVKFGIKTDTSNPEISWKVLDEKGNEVATAKTLASIESRPKDESSGIEQNANAGVLDYSAFKLIPSDPKVGSSLRVVGEMFAPNADLKFYIGDTNVKSFKTNDDGNFVTTITVPENQPPERTYFIVIDEVGNDVVMDLRVKKSETRIVEPHESKFSAGIGGTEFIRGQQVKLTGTAIPLSTVTVLILDPNGDQITTIPIEVSINGTFELNEPVPLESPFGEYTIQVTDAENSISLTFNVKTGKRIQLSPIKQIFEPGEILAINGTAIPNQPLELSIEDPSGLEKDETVIEVDDSGQVYYEFLIDEVVTKGTWIIFAEQGEEREIIFLGVGGFPEEPILIRADKLNYKNTEDVILEISGPTSSTLSLIVVTSGDQEKFSDTITLGPDGRFTYTLDLDGYPTGVFTAVIKRGNIQSNTSFSIGLQTGLQPIEMSVTKNSVLPGEGFLIIGNSSPSILVTVSLFDPDGTLVEKEEIFTGKDGVFTTSLRIPSGAAQGTWKVESRSGPNFTTLDMTVIPQTEEGLVVIVDKTPPIYNRGEFLTINGFDAVLSRSISISILSQDETEIVSLTTFSTNEGVFTTIWTIPEDMETGEYTIKVDDTSNIVQTTFRVQ